MYNQEQKAGRFEQVAPATQLLHCLRAENTKLEHFELSCHSKTPKNTLEELMTLSMPKQSAKINSTNLRQLGVNTTCS